MSDYTLVQHSSGLFTRRGIPEDAEGDYDCWGEKYEGTAQDNSDDRSKRGRTAALETHGNARLTADDVRKLRAGTVTADEIAALRDVTMGAVHHALTGRNWKNLED
jgi:hypothetical protein